MFSVEYFAALLVVQEEAPEMSWASQFHLLDLCGSDAMKRWNSRLSLQFLRSASSE
jgi:hypothetical protein